MIGIAKKRMPKGDTFFRYYCSKQKYPCQNSATENCDYIINKEFQMSEKENNIPIPEEEHICDDECECDDNIITLETEDGTKKNFILLGTLENEGKIYLAIVEEGDNQYEILQVTNDDEELVLTEIGDDEEFTTIANMFDAQFTQEMEQMAMPDHPEL